LGRQEQVKLIIESFQQVFNIVKSSDLPQAANLPLQKINLATWQDQLFYND